jgi:hypothetical protein
MNLAESMKSRDVRSIVVHGGKQTATQTALSEGVRSMDVRSFVQMLYQPGKTRSRRRATGLKRHLASVAQREIEHTLHFSR